MRMRLTVIGLLSVLLCSLTPSATAADGQDDAYRFLVEAGAIKSSAQTHAEQFLTRGEVIQLLMDVRPATHTLVERYRGRRSTVPLFVDVDQDDWVAPYAEAAFALRITTGFLDRTLRPEETIPVEEAITLLLRAYQNEGEAQGGDSEWFAPFIRKALRRNLIARPREMSVGGPVMRGQFFDMVYRMAVVDRDGIEAFPIPPDLSAPPPSFPTGYGVAAGALQQEIPPERSPVFMALPTRDENVLRAYRSSRDFAITIPALDIRDLTVTHPQDSLTQEGLLRVLHDGVGHLFSYPGRGGKIMIYGHSSGYAWDVSQYTKIFTQVNKLQHGDRVYVTFNGQVFPYEVTGQETISPNDSRPFSGQGEELILYTCWPVGSNKSRLIVKAVPVEMVAVR